MDMTLETILGIIVVGMAGLLGSFFCDTLDKKI